MLNSAPDLRNTRDCREHTIDDQHLSKQYKCHLDKRTNPVLSSRAPGCGLDPSFTVVTHSLVLNSRTGAHCTKRCFSCLYSGNPSPVKYAVSTTRGDVYIAIVTVHNMHTGRSLSQPGNVKFLPLTRSLPEEDYRYRTVIACGV